MKRILLLILLGLIYTIIPAQNQISGTITNNQGEPLPGAAVFLPEQNKGTVSNQEGFYLLENLPSGKTRIQFSYLGYNTEMRIISMETTSTAELNISLTPAIIQSQEVVVTGIGISSQHDNAVKIDVLNSREIRNAGTPNLMETLTSIPGVDMIAKGQGVAKPVIRGLSMNDILVLNNGVRMENYQYGENHPLGVDANGVDKIEIIKGPASLLYGSDAIGGVINFTKEKPAATGSIRGFVESQVHSNTNGLNNSVGLKGSSEHLLGGISINHKTHEDYQQGGGDFVPNTRFNEWSLSTNGGYTGKTGTFRLFYDYFNQDLGMSVPPAIALVSEPGRKNKVWYQDLEHHLLNSRNTLFLGNVKWENNLAWQSALRKLKTTGINPFVEMRLNTFTYESKVHFAHTDKTDYTIGLQGMSQTNRNLNNRESQFLPDAEVNNLGILMLAQYAPVEGLKLQGGVRYDFLSTDTDPLGIEGSDDYHAPVSKEFSSFSGSAGATYTIHHKWILRANVARAFRAPNISELTSHGMHGSRYEEGNPDLDPQKALETDLSVHYHGEFMSLDGAVFFNHIDDYIFLSPTSEVAADGTPVFQFRQTNARLYGGEAGLHVHPRAIPWLHLKGTWSTVTGKQENEDYLPFIPAGKFRYEVRASKKNMWGIVNPSVKLWALTALDQDQPAPDETATGGYTLVNATLSGGFEVGNLPVEMTFGVNNLFNKQYFDHLSTLKGLGYYNQGRNISASIRVEFGQ
jgi:iron complex outermembrane receptor protein